MKRWLSWYGCVQEIGLALASWALPSICVPFDLVKAPGMGCRHLSSTDFWGESEKGISICRNLHAEVEEAMHHLKCLSFWNPMDGGALQAAVQWCKSWTLTEGGSLSLSLSCIEAETQTQLQLLPENPRDSSAGRRSWGHGIAHDQGMTLAKSSSSRGTSERSLGHKVLHVPCRPPASLVCGPQTSCLLQLFILGRPLFL